MTGTPGNDTPLRKTHPGAVDLGEGQRRPERLGDPVFRDALVGHVGVAVSGHDW
jgi:hypothetical protein